MSFLEEDSTPPHRGISPGPGLSCTVLPARWVSQHCSPGPTAPREAKGPDPQNPPALGEESAHAELHGAWDSLVIGCPVVQLPQQSLSLNIRLLPSPNTV